jgi:hypothetical protein
MSGWACRFQGKEMSMTYQKPRPFTHRLLTGPGGLLALVASLGWIQPALAGHGQGHGTGNQERGGDTTLSDLPPGRPLDTYRPLLGPLGRSGGLYDRGVRYSVWESARGAEKTVGPGLLPCDPLLTSGFVYLPHVVVTVEETGARRVVGIVQLREVKGPDSIPDFMKLSEERAALLEPSAASSWGQLERSFAALTGPKKRYVPLSNRNDMQVWATSLAGGQVRSVIFHPVWPEGAKDPGLLQRIECRPRTSTSCWMTGTGP